MAMAALMSSAICQRSDLMAASFEDSHLVTVTAP
jgi:hypothetical protein